MIDLLLVLPAHCESQPSLTLPTLEKYLTIKGFKIVTYALQDNNDILHLVKFLQPRYVGVSVPFTFYAQSAVELIQLIKNNTRVPIVVGGVHVCVCPDEFKEADYVCTGYGEQYLEKLLTGVNPVAGVDMDELPTIFVPNSFDVTPDGQQYIRYLGSRGCVFNCYFCSNKRLSGGRIRYRSIKKVVNDLYHFKKHGVDGVSFCDETFTIDRGRTMELCNSIIDNNVDIRWWCMTRVNLIDDKLIRTMKQAGCIGISFGVETGDEEILRESCKGINLDDVTRAVSICKNNDIGCYGGFILGHPHDTIQSVNKTLNFACDSKLDYASFSSMCPYPGTRVRSIAEMEGGLLTSDWGCYHYRNIVYQPPGLKNIDLLRLRLYCQGRFIRSNKDRFIHNLSNTIKSKGWRIKADMMRKLFYSLSIKYRGG